jgi:hypothetical protein
MRSKRSSKNYRSYTSIRVVAFFLTILELFCVMPVDTAAAFGWEVFGPKPGGCGKDLGPSIHPPFDTGPVTATLRSFSAPRTGYPTRSFPAFHRSTLMVQSANRPDLPSRANGPVLTVTVGTLFQNGSRFFLLDLPPPA